MHKKTITVLAISLIATAAQAEWRFLTPAGDTDLYIDYSTIKKTRHGVRAWFVLDHASPGNIGQLSDRVLGEYDCKEERFRFLSTSGFAGHMATSDVLLSDDSPSEWTFIPPGTSGMTRALKAVCKHK